MSCIDDWLIGLAEVYGRKPLSHSARSIYYHALRIHCPEDIGRAFLSAATRHEWPTPAIVRQEAEFYRDMRKAGAVVNFPLEGKQ